MKNPKITYISIGGALLMTVVYWIFTQSGTSSMEQRKLIANNESRHVPTEQVAQPMTKSEAYTERQQETEQDNEKLDFAMKNQRPQKLAASVTRAMQSPYEKKLEEMKSERATVPIYDGKPFSVSADEEAPSLTTSLSVGQQRKKGVTPSYSKPVQHKKIQSQQKEATSTPIPTPVPAAGEDGNVFNTTTIQHTVTEPSLPMEANPMQAPIKASVFGGQSIKSGGLLKFRLMEKATIDGNTFDRNTFFSGKCSFGQDRLLVVVDKMPLAGGGYKRVELVVHDPNDFQEGLFAPSDQTKEGAVEAATDGVQSIISSVPVPGANIGAGVAQLFKTAVNGTQKITVPDGHPVILLMKSL